MTYSPAPVGAQMMKLPMIGMLERLTIGYIGATGSAAWIGANEAIFIPFYVPAVCTVQRLWTTVGTTGGTNSISMGLYEGTKRLVVTASTTLGTANTIQLISITATILRPGTLYYFGIAQNGTTGTHVRLSMGAEAQRPRSGLYNQTVYPLPATATFGSAGWFTYIPVVGLCTTTSP